MSEQTVRVRQRYSAEFKQRAIEQMATSTNHTALAEQLGIRRKFLYLWREQYQTLGTAAFTRGVGRPPQSVGSAVSPASPVRGTKARATEQGLDRQLIAQRERIALLERQLGQKQLEVDFFKRTFAHVRGALADGSRRGGTPSTAASKPDSRAKAND